MHGVGGGKGGGEGGVVVVSHEPLCCEGKLRGRDVDGGVAVGPGKPV